MYDPDEIDSDENEKYDFKYRFQCDIEIINTYSELIRADIVHVTPPKNIYCKDCFQKAVLGIDYQIPIKQIANEFINRAELYVSSYNDIEKDLLFSIKNMDEFFPDHNILVPLNKTALQLIPYSDRHEGATIHNPKLKEQFLTHYIENDFFNACYYATYCKQQGARLITNKLSDSLFLSLTKASHKINILQEQQTLLPQYDLPIVTGLKIADIIHLREIELEAFTKYRIALNNAVNEQIKTKSQVDWKQIYDDILYPAFNNLDLKLRQIKSSSFNRTFATMGICITAILAGKYTGILPENINTLFASISATMAAEGGNYLLDRCSSKKSDLLDNDYYFLWKLKEKK